MSIEVLVVFIITLFVTSIIPGPSMLIALTHGVKYGAKATMATALGNTMASCIQAVISIAGLGVLIATSGSLFLIIKYIGAVYLVYLGVMLWRSASFSLEKSASYVSATVQPPLVKMFRQGFVIAAGNPKAIIFFSALFPQFIDPGQTSLSQYLIMVSLVCICAFSCAMSYAIGGNYLASLFKTSNISKFINKFTGGVFVTSGLGLIISSK
ncbi:MAG: LysE family translocator [Pseudomonadales bacterium]|nr:LysE family translocator [Pseudomonadales bacterium]NRA13866.1 LysE family translocator [Oceanospirillaceae bacterium]